jgi:hypothetical protein
MVVWNSSGLQTRQPRPQLLNTAHRLFFACVRRGRFNLEGFITHEFPPEDCASAYALAESAREKTLGLLFDWTRGRGSAAGQARNAANATPMKVPIT